METVNMHQAKTHLSVSVWEVAMKPFDRILIARAITENITLLTSNRLIL